MTVHVGVRKYTTLTNAARTHTHGGPYRNKYIKWVEDSIPNRQEYLALIDKYHNSLELTGFTQLELREGAKYQGIDYDNLDFTYHVSKRQAPPIRGVGRVYYFNVTILNRNQPFRTVTPPDQDGVDLILRYYKLRQERAIPESIMQYYLNEKAKLAPFKQLGLYLNDTQYENAVNWQQEQVNTTRQTKLLNWIRTKSSSQDTQEDGTSSSNTLLSGQTTSQQDAN